MSRRDERFWSQEATAQSQQQLRSDPSRCASKHQTIDTHNLVRWVSRTFPLEFLEDQPRLDLFREKRFEIILNRDTFSAGTCVWALVFEFSSWTVRAEVRECTRPLARGISLENQRSNSRSKWNILRSNTVPWLEPHQEVVSDFLPQWDQRRTSL